MSARQLIVLAVAFVAAIGALLLIRGLNARDSAPAPAAQTQIVGEQILVAARPVAQGAAIVAEDLAWRPFPKEAVSENYVTATSSPEARADLVGAVTRRPFLDGEPILAGTLVKPGDQGLMAALLPPGYRAVSIEMDSQDAAGGYIHPNDRVDVLLTTAVDAGEGQRGKRARTVTVLQNVRVLALGSETQPADAAAEGPQRQDSETAVLELTEEDSRALRAAAEMGTVSLALRGVETEAAGLRPPSAQPRRGVLDPPQAPSEIRVHAFGAVSEGGGS